MTDIITLKEKIKNSGITMVSISNKTGIKRGTLYNKVNGMSEFTASEIVSLTDVLHLSKDERDEIFLK